MKDDIYSLTPVNRTASLVAGQAGCDDDMTPEDKRDSMARALEAVTREIAGLPKKHRYRKELGQKKLKLQLEMTGLNKKLKEHRSANSQGELNKYLIAECKRRHTRSEWKEIVRIAKEARRLGS